ncbi:MAG TPA: prenyltransferase/squalene oxidase repeat-containing protein [Kofleriaceae bacterium]|nr:prenyltransferase/squalene oxidase repeat-containing protein [Kofleriaceae bacterium]
MILRGQDPSGHQIGRAIEAALDVLAEQQTPRGSWRGDYGGPLFLLPMYVGVARTTGLVLDDDTRTGMTRYLLDARNPDGGWGLSVQTPSCVFTTSLCYVALRQLGQPAEAPWAADARAWLAAHGGPLASASWGKFFLALMNLYDYAGVDPVPPELWLLPRLAPIHPGRMWCHSRMVYLPMSYLYGHRVSAPADELVRALRTELYERPFADIDWVAARGRVAATDRYVPLSPVMRSIHAVLHQYERHPSALLRRRAFAVVLDQIRQEDENTGYVCIGPINKLFHTLIWHREDPRGRAFAAHAAQLPAYLWRGPDGVKMQGYESSELWDTAFAAQAIVATGRAGSHRAMVSAAHRFIDAQQVPGDVPDRRRYFRDPSRGGWPFSTRTHGWPITDCTAEGIMACAALAPHVDAPLPKDRLAAAVDLLLGWQNDDGGWATYERTRGPRWLEQLNPSSCFADIMIDYSYVECTAACLRALARYRERYPGDREHAIGRAIARGARFLRRQQRTDHAWEGSWGVCFTYGTWFAVTGLRAAGATADDPAIANACEFLIGHQLPDGGWGEQVESCRARSYVSTDRGQAVMTSWALLALCAGPAATTPAIKRGVAFLCERQRADGTWRDEHIAGVFNKTCGIHYDNYVRLFPPWALAVAAPRLGLDAGRVMHVVGLPPA